MKACSLYVLFVFVFSTARTQQFPNIQFSYLTSKEGLSNNNVSCISQDQEGFIWIGTEDGLNRFDGYRLKRFFHNPANENSLVNNVVHQVMSDRKDRLWISTREGLSIYDKKTGLFRNFRHNPGDSTSLDNDEYIDLYTNKNNSTLVTTGYSVYYFDSFFHYKKFSTALKNLNDVEKRKIESYKRVMRDHRGNLWGSSFDYIFQIDEKTMRATKRFGPFAGNIEVIYEDSNLQFWVGSFGGVRMFLLIAKTFCGLALKQVFVMHSRHASYLICGISPTRQLYHSPRHQTGYTLFVKLAMDIG